MEVKTDVTKLIVAFRKFANATNKVYNVPENAVYCFSFYGYIINETLELFVRNSVRRQTVNITAHFIITVTLYEHGGVAKPYLRGLEL